MDARLNVPDSSFLGSRTPGRHPSVMSSISRMWRSNPRPADMAASQQLPGKTFVVPLFLSTSRSSARNNLFGRGDLGGSIRSQTAAGSTLHGPLCNGQEQSAIPGRRDGADEASDMYGGSVRYASNSSASEEPVPLAANMDDSSTGPLDVRTVNSSRSGRQGTSKSSRTGRKRAPLTRKSFRDPKVNAKAKVSFAFGITLLVTLIICEFGQDCPRKHY